jgi:hypothetical protein
MSEVIEPGLRFFDRYRYLIIDAERREEIPQSWAAAPIAPAFLQDDTARCPLLVDTAAIPDASLGALLNQSAVVDKAVLLNRLETETAARQDTLVSLALASIKPFSRLRTHLTQRLEINVMPDRRRRQFRYFDPGTFIQLPDVLGATGFSWLLGPIDAVAVPWLGEWREYANPHAEDAYYFRLRQQHIDDLQALSVVNRVLAQLPGLRDQQDWRDKGAATRVLVARARTAYGLDQRDDLVVFALHAWKWHPAFDRHPILQELLAKLAAAAPEDELDYRTLTARLDEADWQKIVRDLEAAPPAQGESQ